MLLFFEKGFFNKHEVFH